MPFKFIREQSIKHSREVVEQNLARYQPLNYNRFMWWRSHTDGITPFNESSYFWQAQLALHNAKDKINLNKHNHPDQLEILAVDLSRYKRLMEDFNKEDNARLEALYDAFISTFNMTRTEFIDEICEWTDDLLSYYKHCMKFKYVVSNTNKKSKRGRPKKT